MCTSSQPAVRRNHALAIDFDAYTKGRLSGNYVVINKEAASLSLQLAEEVASRSPGRQLTEEVVSLSLQLTEEVASCSPGRQLTEEVVSLSPGLPLTREISNLVYPGVARCRGGPFLCHRD